MDPVPVPRTAVEWDRVREAKEDVLGRDPFKVSPADHPHVRPEVVSSWRRSMIAGVDPGSTGFPVDPEFRSSTRLAAVAQPIMNRLKDQISDLNSIGFLTDRACRLLTAVVGDFPGDGRIHQLMPHLGACVAEEIIGTTGLGCAHELQRPVVISGSEHFRTDAEMLTTTGVVIRDPFTKRYAGTLGVHCRREYGSAAILPLVVEIGRSIETQLLASRTDVEREFFDAFSSAQRRFGGAIVGVSSRVYVASNGARDLVCDADEELLRSVAADSGAAGRTLRRRLRSGATVRIEVLPVSRPRGEYAAVLVLVPVERSDSGADGRRARGWTGDRTETAADVRASLDRALSAGHPVLLTGERGSGKRHEARRALTSATGHGTIVELDGTLAHRAPRDWADQLCASVRSGATAVLISHVTEVPSELAPTVADLITRVPGPVIGTTAHESWSDDAAPLLRETFPVTLTVPPLRERRDEFAELCEDLLTGLGRPDEPVALAPRALAALAAGDWPGNVRQLVQVLTSARIRTTSLTIDLPDLPAQYGPSRNRSPLDEVHRAERDVLMAALRAAGGDRNAVAERLGISRATVYRKLKRYQLH
ncbi:MULTISPECIES: helix-turn-helix domain-containing protein [unclassified Modestobacter]